MSHLIEANLIEAKRLYRYFGKHCVVKDVSFTLSRGEVLGFLGPNGAGKTTTLQMLCGLLAPDSGEISINGINLLTQAKLAKQSLGYLPDTPPLYKDLTVQEFLRYCGRLHGLAKDHIPRAIAQTQERCGLQEVTHKLIGHLSKGFQQRLGIALAILHNPDVVILDEPTVGLDPLQIREIRALIRELGQDHGVILSTHILSEVQDACTHVQIIHQGQLVLHESVAGLNRHLDTGLLQVTTRLAPDLAVLAAISGITRIDTVADTQLHIHYRVSDNPTQRLTETVIANGWGLQELTPVKQSMEDIFVSLTKETPTQDKPS
ncbi:MAG: ABC transporter ATP-binding protein [Methylovulum sp.]|uniref:ABC transporter ATP-binding protein n=1 Tax=Methylovulum sp. TaxID=1916980 RepID=UPI00263901BB|nr:ABC transporter ATP-binding protein [Methylovulum sp.]MDD2723784.1 ABC transporter ATP-binding protein [Methylovulum sp.]MDD5123641.1 ABC transporter ATP-binding protein [Methylovulum sp.]